MAVPLQALVKAVKGREYVLFQSHESRLLKTVRAVQRFPEIDGRGENHIRIAHDVYEPSIGKQLEKNRYPRGVRRRFENQPSGVFVVQIFQEPQEIPLPAGQCPG